MSETPESPPPDETLTLIVPQFLHNSLNCFVTNREQDIAHIYKISLKSSNDEPLYIENELDLRDTLKQYCLYRKLCEKIDEEMKKLNLQFQLSENNVSLKPTKHKVDFFRPPPVRFNLPGGECEHDCGTANNVGTGTSPETQGSAPQTDPPPPDEEVKKACCVIL